MIPILQMGKLLRDFPKATRLVASEWLGQDVNGGHVPLLWTVEGEALRVSWGTRGQALLSSLHI